MRICSQFSVILPLIVFIKISCFSMGWVLASPAWSLEGLAPTRSLGPALCFLCCGNLPPLLVTQARWDPFYWVAVEKDLRLQAFRLRKGLRWSRTLALCVSFLPGLLSQRISQQELGGFKQQKCILSEPGLEVCSQGVSRAVLPWDSERDSSMPLPSFWGGSQPLPFLTCSRLTSASTSAVTGVFPLRVCPHFPLLRRKPIMLD